MNFFDAIILGIVQGATEFIPVSSSGHLVLLREWLDISQVGALTVDAILQLATACAVLLYFRKDIGELLRSFFQLCVRKEIKTENRSLILALILGTIPAVIAGLALEDLMETAFRSPLLVAAALVAGSIVLFAAERLGKEDMSIDGKRGFAVGLFQVLALVPGFSRSGATISGGLFLGLSKVEATRFGFLLSVPILFGSGVKKLFEIGTVPVSGSLVALSAVVAFLVGLAAIDFLIKYVKNHSFNVFVVYRLLLAAFIVFAIL